MKPDQAKWIYRCENHHAWVEGVDGPNEWRKPHIGCGGLITSAGWVKPEEEQLVFLCHICNQAELPHFNKELNRRLRETQTCFYCDFWLKKVKWREENRSDCFVIDGHHYNVANENGSRLPDIRGFGGRKFVILANDGRRIETTNLWYQGDVPPHFREKLADNARFETSQQG